MERHQDIGQEKTLVEVRVETDSLEVVHRPRGSPDGRGCFKCAVALATVMGLVIVALVAGFILHFFMFTPSCNQDAPPLSDTTKVSSELKKSDERGRYDIFTVDKSATYLIYGWVKLSNVTREEEVKLMQTFDGKNRKLDRKNASETKIIFFHTTVKLVNGSRISLSFSSAYTGSLFHLYEL